MGDREGDNNQLRSLAASLGYPFELKPMTYNWARHVPVLRRGLTSLTARSRGLIKPPWPDLVIGCGYRAVPVARYVRERTGGRARLVHIGNPRAKLPDFHLQIATPQYSRSAPNVLELLFPIGNPAKAVTPTQDEADWLLDYPPPRRIVAVGGPARNWKLDHVSLVGALQTIRSKTPEGSMIIAISRRTPATTRQLLQATIGGDAEAVVDDFPRLGTLMATSDEIHVTADSVSMVSEAVLSGKPVGLIPIKRSPRGLLTSLLWERPTGRSTFPDLRRFWELLDRRHLIGTVEQPIASRTHDTIECAVSAVRSIMTPDAGLGAPGL